MGGTDWSMGSGAYRAKETGELTLPANAAAIDGAPKITKQPRTIRAAFRASMRPCKAAKPIHATEITATAVAAEPVANPATHCTASRRAPKSDEAANMLLS